MEVLPSPTVTPRSPASATDEQFSQGHKRSFAEFKAVEEEEVTDQQQEQGQREESVLESPEKKIKVAEEVSEVVAPVEEIKPVEDSQKVEAASRPTEEVAVSSTISEEVVEISEQAVAENEAAVEKAPAVVTEEEEVKDEPPKSQEANQ